jgi:dienelactone hydrolase
MPYLFTKKTSTIKRLWPLFMVLVALLLSTANSYAEDVQQTYKGLKLNAKTNMPVSALEGKRVFLILHGTLAHGSMDIINGVLNVLEENDEAGLAITLSLGISDRKGMFPCDARHQHHHEDAIAELAVWLDWLASKNATEVILVGHSRGAVQVVDYIAATQDERVKGAVLIAPGRSSKAAEDASYERSGHQDLTVESFLHCGKSIVTADSYASYYGTGEEPSTEKALSLISLPIALFLGSEDKVVPPDTWLQSQDKLSKTVKFSVIDGADHFFRDLYTDEIVEQIIEWQE